MERCVYAIPNASVFDNDEIMRLEKEVEASRVSPAALRTKLQVNIHINMHVLCFLLFCLFLLTCFPPCSLIGCGIRIKE